ncbi:hypothetical protein B0H14DRAFT_3749470 [Mycena olivaceomarginata]|nr:hypothetical protein B0H14DRAFT_3749470 [Mycena olivaceomarginata]
MAPLTLSASRVVYTSDADGAASLAAPTLSPMTGTSDTLNSHHLPAWAAILVISIVACIGMLFIYLLCRQYRRRLPNSANSKPENPQVSLNLGDLVTKSAASSNETLVNARGPTFTPLPPARRTVQRVPHARPTKIYLGRRYALEVLLDAFLSSQHVSSRPFASAVGSPVKPVFGTPLFFVSVS